MDSWSHLLMPNEDSIFDESDSEVSSGAQVERWKTQFLVFLPRCESCQIVNRFPWPNRNELILLIEVSRGLFPRRLDYWLLSTRGWFPGILAGQTQYSMIWALLFPYAWILPKWQLKTLFNHHSSGWKKPTIPGVIVMWSAECWCATRSISFMGWGRLGVQERFPCFTCVSYMKLQTCPYAPKTFLQGKGLTPLLPWVGRGLPGAGVVCPLRGTCTAKEQGRA